jgi:hypothetical protein
VACWSCVCVVSPPVPLRATIVVVVRDCVVLRFFCFTGLCRLLYLILIIAGATYRYVCLFVCLALLLSVQVACLSLAKHHTELYFPRMVGLDWIGLHCIALHCIGLDWIGLDWIGLDCKYIPILVAIVQYYWYTLIAMPLARCIAYIVSLTGRVYRHQPNYTLLQSEWNYRECVNKVNATRLSIASAGNSSALLSRAKSEAF